MMSMPKDTITFFKTAGDFRDWLEQHHVEAQELWVGFHKKNSGKASITWPEAVDQALCFGWIDGIRKSIDETSYKIRFTPRRPGSTWSAVNIQRATELINTGLMQPAGLNAFEERDQKRSGTYSYEQEIHELDEVYEKQLRANHKAWEFFQAQPPYYRRAASWWVTSAKKEETRLKRLATLIEDSAHGRTIAPLTRNPK